MSGHFTFCYSKYFLNVFLLCKDFKTQIHKASAQANEGKLPWIQHTNVTAPNSEWNSALPLLFCFDLLMCPALTYCYEPLAGSSMKYVWLTHNNRMWRGSWGNTEEDEGRSHRHQGVDLMQRFVPVELPRADEWEGFIIRGLLLIRNKIIEQLIKMLRGINI